MSRAVYITRLAKYLPNRPVQNEEMEKYLGMVDGQPSKARRIVLRNNGIQTRYYALDETGKPTHTNAQLAAKAVKGLTSADFPIENIELIAFGTSLVDQLLPSHTAMIHGELGSHRLELISPSGACCSGMHALKYGWLSILAGETQNAVCGGSELISPMLMARHFQEESDKLRELNERPIIAFEKDFLRWMLSDGAGAALLSAEKPESGLSLKIEWIENASFAHQMPACMYAGGDKETDGSFKGWKTWEPKLWLDHSVFSMKQDVKLLGANIVPLGAKFLKDICLKRNFDTRSITWFLPHLSSEFFRSKVQEELIAHDMEIPASKWFTNLTKVGNVGSASIFLMLEELLYSGNLQPGDKLLLMVPESARFSYVYALLTVC